MNGFQPKGTRLPPEPPVNTNPDSLALLQRLESTYGGWFDFTLARGNGKTYIHMRMSIEYGVAHDFMRRIKNGEHLTEQDFEQALKEELEAINSIMGWRY